MLREAQIAFTSTTIIRNERFNIEILKLQYEIEHSVNP